MPRNVAAERTEPMEPLEWIWVIAAILLGATVGSFVNVVMYRLPRNLSVSKPRRSFCPVCSEAITARDNIPVISFLLLRGRCRRCGARISIRYPVVEIIGALLFVLIVDAFLVAKVREAVSGPEDWSLVAAHLFLVASLLAISGMDIEEYMVDLRITWLIMGVGCVTHMLWASASKSATWQPLPGTGAAAVAATVGLGIARLIWAPQASEAALDGASESTGTPGQKPGSVAAKSGQSLLVWLLVAVLGTGLVLMAIDAAMPLAESSFVWRAMLIMGCCFVGVVGASAIKRDSDDEIVGAIDEERPMARRMVLAELRYLTPAIVLGTAALVGLRFSAIQQAWDVALAWAPIGDHEPVQGLATALSGLIVGGAVGWGVRIGFTLVLGREAFGLGDVHIMAAAGAVTGWMVVTVGFFLGAVLALLGVICLLAVKRSRAIPFGPWLSMGILVAVIAYGPLFDWLAQGFEGLKLVISGSDGL